MIEIKPVKKAKAPKYPTRLKLLEDPSLLERRMPSSWKANAALASAASLLLSGCCFDFSDDDPSEFRKAGSAPIGGSRGGKPAVVAPLFIHGEGRGAFGCVVVSPPVFLSEADALEAIADELSKAGIDVSQKDVRISGVKVHERAEDRNGKVVESFLKSHSVQADFYDPARKVAVDYVSYSNYRLLGGIDSSENGWSAWGFDLKETAKDLAKAVGKDGKDLKFGAFYDPVSYMDMEGLPKRPEPSQSTSGAMKKPRGGVSKEESAWFRACDQWEEGARKAAIEKSKELLRLQVKDFVEWLKAQGAI